MRSSAVLRDRRHLAVDEEQAKPFEYTDFQKLIHSLPEEISRFLGGGRGGAKSSGISQDVGITCERHRSDARILFIRQGPYKALNDFIETLSRFFDILWGFKAHSLNQGSHIWTVPTGTYIELGILPDGEHGRRYYETAYQGRSFCVAVGTPVLMSDGTFRAIQDIRVGECVATLEGPKQVRHVLPPYHAACVTAFVRDSQGDAVGTQIHPVTHPVLSTSGVLSRPYGCSLRSGLPSPAEILLSQSSPESHPCAPQGNPGWLSFSEGGRTGCKGSWDGSSEASPLAGWSFPVVLHARALRSAQAQGLGDPYRKEPSDESGTTHTHTRSPSLWYKHPYTGQERCLSEEVEVGWVDLVPCGQHLVCDIEVDGANHYITAGGLVNKNTHIYVDECQQYSRLDVIDLLISNLRGPIPTRITLAANPGGPGHQAIAARYINNGVGDWKPFELHREVRMPSGEMVDTTRTWISCPSTYLDNPHNGPDYLSNLAIACGNDQELLKAWVSGNWNIARGAYFATVLDNPRIRFKWQEPTEWCFWEPSDWKFWMSYDHGTAAPAIAYVMAMSPGAEGPDGRYYAAGSVLILDEYACHREGDLGRAFNWTIPQLCVGIKGLALRWQIAPRGVADDACFSDTGSMAGTIADEYAREGVIWRRARKGRRAARFQEMKRLLAAAGRIDEPGLYVSERCQYWWQTVPYLIHDPMDREVPLKCDTDHGLDASSYGMTGAGVSGGVVRI